MKRPRARRRVHHAGAPRAVKRRSVGKWYGVLLTGLGLLTLVGKAVLVDLQAVRAVVEVVAHPHRFGS